MQALQNPSRRTDNQRTPITSIIHPIELKSSIVVTSLAIYYQSEPNLNKVLYCPYDMPMADLRKQAIDHKSEHM